MSVSDVGGGVFVSPMPITKGDRVTLKYNGLLSKSGATSIFAHVGYGPVDWMDVQDIPMTKEPDGTWTVNIEMAEDQISPLNVVSVTLPITGTTTTGTTGVFSCTPVDRSVLALAHSRSHPALPRFFSLDDKLTYFLIDT